MIPLTTRRLRLRPLDDADLGFVRRLHAHPSIARFIPSAVTPDDATARRHLERFQTLAEHPVQGFSLVEQRETGEPVALVMVKPVPPSGGAAPEVLEIGWRQVAEHCGNGYVTEAAGAVLDAVHARGVSDVVAVTDPANLASQHVAERLGMERVGATRAFYDEETVLFRSHRERPPGTAWLPEGWELLAVGEYASPGPLRDRLVGAVLEGGKRTTTHLVDEDRAAGEEPVGVGHEEVVVDSAGEPVCVTRTVSVDVVPLAAVTLEHAVGEGEGYTDVASWRAGHERFWSSPGYREWFASLDLEPPSLGDGTLAVCERFEVLAQRPGSG